MSRVSPMKKGDVGKLLNRSYESWYWLGFILADGSFSGNRLKLALGEEDQHQVERFVNYLGKEYTNENSGTFMCINSIPKIKSLLHLSDLPKTYYPPSIKLIQSLKKEELLSLFIGFVDGDGSIQFQTGRKTTKVSIKLHSSWLDFLQNLVNKIYCVLDLTQETVAKINNSGYSYVTIGNFSLQKKLKQFYLKYKLPVLVRKWGKIDLNLETRKERTDRLSKEAKKLHRKGATINEVADQLNINYNTAYYAVRR